MARVLTLFLLELERLNEFGRDRFCTAGTDDGIVMWSIATCIVPRGTCLWYVARDLTNLLIAAERLIRFGPDRQRLA